MDDCNQSEVNEAMLDLIKGISEALASQLELMKTIVGMIDEELYEKIK